MCRYVTFLIFALFLYACGGDEASTTKRLQAEEEIRLAEAEFAAMAGQEGVPAAFLHFAAGDAVLLRGERLVEGRDALQVYFAEQPYDSVELNWKPDFVRASLAGDLGYTYGRYTFLAVDSTGQEIQAAGIFHTVWQRQPDGSWRFVWD